MVEELEAVANLAAAPESGVTTLMLDGFRFQLCCSYLNLCGWRTERDPFVTATGARDRGRSFDFWIPDSLSWTPDRRRKSHHATHDDDDFSSAVKSSF